MIIYNSNNYYYNIYIPFTFYMCSYFQNYKLD